MRISFIHRAVPPLAVAALVGIMLPRASSGGAFHLRLTKSEPGTSDTVAAAPAVLKLWFSEEPQLAITRVTLVSERGDTVALASLAHVRGVGNPVVAAIKGRMGSGRHTVSWRAASADGHAQSGTFAFVVAPARADSRAR